MIEKRLKKIDRKIVPICCHCKKIRDEEGSWEIVSKSFYEGRKIDHSHSVCPECRTKFYNGM